MRSFSDISSSLKQKIGVSIKDNKLSPIMKLIKKHKSFKMMPYSDGYKVYIGKYCFFILQDKTSVKVFLLSNDKYKISQDKSRSEALDVFVDLALILFADYAKIPVKIYALNTHDEAYIWQYLRGKKRDYEAIDMRQKKRFKHWESLRGLSSVSLKSLDFDSDLGKKLDNKNNVIATLQIEGEQIIKIIDFSLLYSDWSMSYEESSNSWTVEAYGHKFVGIQEGEWQALMTRVISVLELGAAELLAKLAMIMYQGSSSIWSIVGDHPVSVASLNYASWVEGAVLEREIHQSIEHFVKENAASSETQMHFLAEQGAAAVSNQALDHLLFGFDKGERSYRKQSLKRQVLSKSWFESKRKLESNKNDLNNDPGNNPDDDLDDGFSGGKK